MYEKKPIKNFEQYSIDTDGVIYSKKDKPLKYSINHNGYCIVNFYVNHKRTGFSVHALVAATFIPNEDKEKNQVNHKNGIKTDNRVENLEWVTRSENEIHKLKHGLSNVEWKGDIKIVFLDNTEKIYESTRICAKDLNTSHTNIRNWLKRETVNDFCRKNFNIKNIFYCNKSSTTSESD